MPERPFPKIPRQAPTGLPAPAATPVPDVTFDPAALRELTPRALFTNLFLVTLPAGALGPIQSAKADKAEFEDRKKPQFYQLGDEVYCYGAGQEEFADRRFSAAIVTADTNRNFTKFLLTRGLMQCFRDQDFKLQANAQGFAVQDHTEIIRSSSKGTLHIIPQYNFQPYWVECANGAVRFAISIEARTTTLPTFHIHEALRRVDGALDNLELVLEIDRCKPGCPLRGRKGEVLGRFRGFADPGEPLHCTCHADTFDPVAIRVVDRRRKPGTPRRRTGRRQAKTDYVETTLVIPGQLVFAGPSQRRLLKLFKDRPQLEHAGKEWLGSVSADGRIRANGLQVRYERIQRFLARMARHSTGPLSFSLPTGTKVTLERMPLTVEELSDVDGGESPYRDDELDQPHE